MALKTILKEIDPHAFEQSLNLEPAKKKELRIEQDPEERKKMDEKWVKVYEEVKKKHPEFQEPDTPFTIKHIVGVYNDLYAKIYDKEKYVSL